jgi:hypothetical protein
MARNWAVNEGLYPPSLEPTEEGATANGSGAAELRWMFPALAVASAERDVTHVDRVERGVTARNAGTSRSFSAPEAVSFDIEAQSPPVVAAAPPVEAFDPSVAPAPATTPNTAKEAPAAQPTDLATVRFGL